MSVGAMRLKENSPFRLIGNPEDLFSLDPAIAFVTNLLIFKDDDVKLRWKVCTDDLWHTLESLDDDTTLTLP